MRTEAEIRAELESLREAMTVGSMPEVEGMEHALKWVLDPSTFPSPALYAKQLNGTETL